MQPLFLKPVFKERIWGGTSLQQFGYEIPNDRTGECWAISAHPNGASAILNGEFAGHTLIELWKEQPQLFGNPKQEIFPLLTKILDANMDLSVQVHPDDIYAKEHEKGELGKTECWYVIDCKENAHLILGHHANTKEEMIEMIEKDQWNQLLRKVNIHPGDFFFVPSGTIHAICEGTLILETQQSSDTTYRLYDYHRRDDDGNLRELHLDKSIEVTTIPHQDVMISPIISENENVTTTTFVESSFFTVKKYDIHGTEKFCFENLYLLCSVIDGEAQLICNDEHYDLKKGDHFIIPAYFGHFQFSGECSLIVSYC